MEAAKQTGGDSPGRDVACFAAASANSFPGMPQWLGIHCSVTCERQLFKAFLEGWVSDELLFKAWMRAWLSVRILTEAGCCSVIQWVARASALDSSSNELVNSAPRAVRVATTVGFAAGPEHMTAAAPPLAVPLVAAAVLKNLQESSSA